jgi:hypothetical protein
MIIIIIIIVIWHTLNRAHCQEVEIKLLSPPSEYLGKIEMETKEIN